MKLTTVLASVNDNKNYYMFIPKQIIFWKHFNIKFIAIFVGKEIPSELLHCKDNIILWNKNLDINTSYVGQNIRIYYPSLLQLPDDEMVMITDMDMLPTNDTYYVTGLNDYTIDDFIYYRHVDGNEIYMCYNAAHPKTWSNIFNIKTEKDIEEQLYNNYDITYNGIPGSNGWSIDQLILYKRLINYPNLKVLNRPINRLEAPYYAYYLNIGMSDFIKKYDDVHFHRNYETNLKYIIDAENQLLSNN